jgi:hypothetical protein
MRLVLDLALEICSRVKTFRGIGPIDNDFRLFVSEFDFWLNCGDRMVGFTMSELIYSEVLEGLRQLRKVYIVRLPSIQSISASSSGDSWYFPVIDSFQTSLRSFLVGCGFILKNAYFALLRT